jgi:hypothetical protein
VLDLAGELVEVIVSPVVVSTGALLDARAFPDPLPTVASKGTVLGPVCIVGIVG